jgi:hypothetical protein
MTIHSSIDYVLNNISHMIGANGVIVDEVSYFEIAEIVVELKEATGLEPEVDYQLTDPQKALATLLVGLGVWYAGGDGSEALNAAATLFNVFKPIEPKLQYLWKE